MNTECTVLSLELKTKITHPLLKEISISIIDTYRRKDEKSLSAFTARAGLDQAAGIQKAFSALMHIYHPDKLTKIHADIDRLFNQGHTDTLRQLKRTYLFELKPAVQEPAIQRYDTEEDFSYSEDDFGYHDDWEPEKEDPQESSGNDTPEEPEDCIDGINFTEAANLHIYGNLDEALTVSDMRSLDGELDLSDCRISDLAGVHHCINIQSLNLSNNMIISLSPLSTCERLETLYLSENNIESLVPLRSLNSLHELDISFNRIEDISILLTLANLEYVNLVGNPVLDGSTINQLIAQGVTVIR